MTDKLSISINEIENRIFTIRSTQVMIDSHLAEMYNVETKVFNQAVRRNIERFTASFRVQLTEDEWISLRSQFVTLEKGPGQHRKYLPYYECIC